jgi:hypothetical protein
MKFKFSESRTLSKLDSVPEPFRSMYEEKDGQYHLNEAFHAVGDAIDGLNKSLSTERENARKKSVDLSPLSDYGDSPEAIAESFKTKLGELEGQIKSAPNIDKVRQELKTAHEKQLEQANARSTALTSQLHTLLVENQATVAIAGERGDPELVMPHLKQFVRVVEVDDKDGKKKLVAQVVDKDGDPRFDPASSQPLSIHQLVKEFKGHEKYGRLFESDAPSGGGGTAPGRPPQNGAELTANEKIARGLSQTAQPRRFGAGS